MSPHCSSIDFKLRVLQQVSSQFEGKCPTNFSLSPELDKLKLVGHQTDPLLTAEKQGAVQICSRKIDSFFISSARVTRHRLPPAKKGSSVTSCVAYEGGSMDIKPSG